MPDIKLVVLDVDGTLTQTNSWLQLNLALGMTEAEDQALYNQYSDGQISYPQWQAALLSNYQKYGEATKTQVKNVATDFELVPGASDMVHYLQNKYQVILASGSYYEHVAAVASKLDVSHFFAANTFVYDENDCLVAIKSTGDEGDAKRDFVSALALKESLTPNNIACIGDGGNDAQLFTFTQRGITFVGSPLTTIAWQTIPDLPSIKQIL